MSVNSEITRIRTAVSSAYDAVDDMGGTVPASEVIANLPAAIRSIPTGGGSGDGYVWQDQDGYVHLSDEPSSQTVVEPLSVTANGTYTATSGHAYSPVTVNVSGGGTTEAPKKQINFIDYDGKILYSYTASEWANVTALPDNPTHTGLTAQGWNWTKAQIDAQLTAAPGGDVWVGQMYITASGDTEIDLRFADSARLSPILTIAVNGTITVDWGDGTTADTVTGTSLTTRLDVSHTYSVPGDYMMVIHVVTGEFTFNCTSSYTLLRKNTTETENRVYTKCIQAVRLGNGITGIGSYAFRNCYSLISITIPDSVTSIASSAFYYCYPLRSITIPESATIINSESFYANYSLQIIAISANVTTINSYAFQNSYSLISVTIPSGVTGINNYAFSSCYSLASITIPSSVTSIGNNAFYNCYGVAEYHIKPTSPPTLSNTNAFQNIPSDCVMYVPQASLNDYQTASNWSTYASRMIGE